MDNSTENGQKENKVLVNITQPSPRNYKQQYRKAWELLPEFKGWLKDVSGDKSRAFCAVCNKNLHAHRLTLLKHMTSVKHVKLAQKFYENAKREETQTVEANNANNESQSNTVINMAVDNNVEIVDCQNTVGDAGIPIDGSTVALNQVQAQTTSTRGIIQVTYADEPARKVTNNEATQTPVTLSKPPISTHVLDTAKGLPVPGLLVTLYQLVDGRWKHINDSYTNPDGRCTELITREEMKPGRFKLHFNTDRYFALRCQDFLFPFVEIVFDVRSPSEHLHIPLLMTPYGYTTYRGS